MPRPYFVYIMASRSRVLYIGVTNSVTTRIAQHREHKTESFTAKHGYSHLVFHETCRSPLTAIAREKQLKGWTRAKKITPRRTIKPHLARPQRRLRQITGSHPDRSAAIRFLVKPSPTPPK